MILNFSNSEPTFPGRAPSNERLVILTLGVLLSYRECTRGGFCNFMHLKPISRELRRELYGRRKKKYWNFLKQYIFLKEGLENLFWFVKTSSLSLSPGTALAPAPENDAPAPRIADVIARGGGRGIESAQDDSEGSRDRPTDSLLPVSSSEQFFFFFLWTILLFLFFFLFFNKLVAFSIKQICYSICTTCLHGHLLIK